MKILIVRFSSIGDIVLCTPVIRCIAKQKPEAEIHFVTKPGFVGLLAENPHLTRVWAYKDKSEDWKQLKQEGFDYIIDLHNNLRSRLLSKRLNVQTSRFYKTNRQKWFAVRFKQTKFLPNMHIVDRYMDSVRFLGVQNDDEGLDFFIPQDTVLPSSFDQTTYVCFAIGGQHATKKLTATKIIEICAGAKSQVVLIGGPDDAEVGQQVKQQLPSVIDLCGQLSINQSALVIQGAAAIITHDTGMMHIAAALGKPIVSIWGNTVPEFGMYPYRASEQSKIFEVNNLSCRPCSKIGYDSCPKGHFNCMMQQDIGAIVAHLNGITQ